MERSDQPPTHTIEAAEAPSMSHGLTGIVGETDRAGIDVALKGFDAARAAVEEQMRPLLDIVDIITEGREALLEHYGVQPFGHCERCNKLLFQGELGCTPYADDSSVVYCADHAPTLGDLKAHWDRIDPSVDDEDDADRRAAFSAMLEAHLAAGGTLEHKQLEVLE